MKAEMPLSMIWAGTGLHQGLTLLAHPFAANMTLNWLCDSCLLGGRHGCKSGATRKLTCRAF